MKLLKSDTIISRHFVPYAKKYSGAFYSGKLINDLQIPKYIKIITLVIQFNKFISTRKTNKTKQVHNKSCGMVY